jgi:hypothetical protein
MTCVVDVNCKDIQTQPIVFHSNSKSSEMALVEILSAYHDKIHEITQTQAQGLKQASESLDKASKDFLADLRELFETECRSGAITPFFKALEYVASFMTISLGVGLCASGVASIVGSIMITTGVAGCIHTTLELSNAYKHLSMLTDDPSTKEVIKSYLPAMVATSLALSATVTGTYSAQVALDSTLQTIRLFLPFIMQSLQSTQMITKGIFDLHKNQSEAKKIDHEALVKGLETILDEQQSSMMNNLSSSNRLNKEAISTLKLLSSLYKHV